MSTRPASPPRFSVDDLQPLVPQILERLSRISPLPPHGTVAGQAVASVLWEVMGLPIEGPVKDIDVFVNASVPRPLRGLNHPPNPLRANAQGGRRAKTVSQMRGIQRVVSNYDHLKFIAARLSLYILRTYQAGPINFTLIATPAGNLQQNAHETAVSQELVDGFDLNAVGVGINLDTGRLVASDGFLEFLGTRELKAQTCNTPAHTLVRMARKYHDGELKGITCNYEDQRTMLELAYACQSQYASGGRDSTPYNLGSVLGFGKHYRKEWDRLRTHLPAYDEEKPGPGEEGPTLYTMVPRTQWGELDQALLTWAKNEVLRGELAPLALVAMFPQFRDAFHAASDHLTKTPAGQAATPEQKARIEGFDLIRLAAPSRAKIAEKIQEEQTRKTHEEVGLDQARGLAQALGLPLPAPHMSATDAQFVAAFFFNQRCAKHPDLVNEVVDTWENASNLEQDLIQALNLRADWVLELGRDPKKAWGDMISRRAWETAQALADWNGQETGSPSCRAFLHTLVDILEGQSPDGHRGRLLISPVISRALGKRTLFSTIVLNLSREERAETAQRIVRWDLPQWPDLSGVESSVKHRVLAAWAQAGLEVPPRALENIDGEDVLGLMNQVKGMIGGPGSRLPLPDDIKATRDHSAHQILFHALTQTPIEQWGEKQSILIRAAVYLGETQALEQAIRHLGTPAALLECLNQALDSFGDMAIEDRNNGGWASVPMDEDEESIEDIWRPRGEYLTRAIESLDRVIRVLSLEARLPQAMDSNAPDGEDHPPPSGPGTKRIRM